MSDLSAADVIRLLGLKPHPEGGHYRETFRDERADGGRAHSTAIYFLLAAGEVSRWHRVDAAELWHWHAGAPLELVIAAPGGLPSRLRLGKDLGAGERPQAAPGFEFAGFELAPEGFEPAHPLHRKDVAGGAQK